MMSHERAMRDAHALVAKGLSPKKHEQLREHLRGCDDCMRHYERLRAVEDALSPGEVMAPAALARMSELVLAEVAPPPRRAGLPWIYGLSAAAAMAVVMLIVVPRKDGELTPRGVTTQQSAHGLSVFLIDAATKSAARAEVNGGHVTVPADRLLQLAYRTTNDRHLVVVGIDAGGDAQVYYATGDAMTLTANAVDEPLPGAWDLGDVTPPLRLFAFFSKTAIAPETALATAQRGGTEPTLLIDVTKR